MPSRDTMSDDRENHQQRRSRYVRMAAEAKKLGASEKRFAFRESFLNVAESWLRLAQHDQASDQKADEILPENAPDGAANVN